MRHGRGHASRKHQGGSIATASPDREGDGGDEGGTRGRNNLSPDGDPARYPEGIALFTQGRIHRLETGNKPGGENRREKASQRHDAGEERESKAQ